MLEQPGAGAAVRDVLGGAAHVDINVIGVVFAQLQRASQHAFRFIVEDLIGEGSFTLNEGDLAE